MPQDGIQEGAPVIYNDASEDTSSMDGSWSDGSDDMDADYSDGDAGDGMVYDADQGSYVEDGEQ